MSGQGLKFVGHRSFEWGIRFLSYNLMGAAAPKYQIVRRSPHTRNQNERHTRETHSPDAVKTIPTQQPPRSGHGRMQKGFRVRTFRRPARCLHEREAGDGKFSPVPVPAGTRGINACATSDGFTHGKKSLIRKKMGDLPLFFQIALTLLFLLF